MTMPAGCAYCCERCIPGVTETRRFREALDVRLRSGQKVPALRNRRLARPLDVVRLLLECQRRRLARIDADADDLEIFAGIFRQHAERRRQAAEALQAQHRAAVVDERQHDGPLAEVVANLHRAAVLVRELDVERQHLIQVLIEPDVAQLQPAPPLRARQSSAGCANCARPAAAEPARPALRADSGHARAVGELDLISPPLSSATRARPPSSSRLRWECARRRLPCLPSRSPRAAPSASRAAPASSCCGFS